MTIDYAAQAGFVAQSVWRLLATMDRDPLSPTYGCAHLAYWRDKTSDVSDARRQEAMLPLAMLYSADYPGSSLRGDDTLLTAVQALLSYWLGSQYPDGSLDEWYKGERAFAAAAFGTFAVARTLELVGDKLPAPLLSRARNGLDLTAKWLCGRNDLFKTNHQAVGVGALAYAGLVLDEKRYTAEARRKLESILAVQTPEGWFPEVGRMDPGYTFLTVEYVATAMDLWKDFSLVEPFNRAFDFACRFIHPDMILGDEYGICRNPYVSRIAPILLSGVNPLAAWIRGRLEESPTGSRGLAPTMADDLRLPRWAFQPLAACDFASRITPLPAERRRPLPLAAPARGIESYPLAGQAFLEAGGKAVIASAAAGGLVRFFGPDGAQLTEYGYCLSGETKATSFGYRPGAAPETDGAGVAMASSIAPVKKFMPSYWARIALRLACSTALGSRLARKGIDVIRRRKGTALNQSSPSLSGTATGSLRRKVESVDGLLVLTDSLSFSAAQPTGSIHVMQDDGQGAMRLTPLPELVAGLPSETAGFTLARTYSPDGSWRLTGVTLTDG